MTLSHNSSAHNQKPIEQKLFKVLITQGYTIIQILSANYFLSAVVWYISLATHHLQDLYDLHI